MRHINYKSDFKLAIKPVDLLGADILAADFDWELRFWASVKPNCFTASRRGGQYRNCFVKDGRLVVTFDGHTMGKGQLRVECRPAIPDSDMPDGFFNLSDPHLLDIDLWEGPSDPPTEEDVIEIIFPIINQVEESKPTDTTTCNLQLLTTGEMIEIPVVTKEPINYTKKSIYEIKLELAIDYDNNKIFVCTSRPLRDDEYVAFMTCGRNSRNPKNRWHISEQHYDGFYTSVDESGEWKFNKMSVGDWLNIKIESSPCHLDIFRVFRTFRSNLTLCKSRPSRRVTYAAAVVRKCPKPNRYYPEGKKFYIKRVSNRYMFRAKYKYKEGDARCGCELEFV